MCTVDQKHQIILEHEKRFADHLALKVLEKPKLSVWMILIPIIFVHYFHRIQKFNSGRSAFAENYMIVRKRALDEALEVIQTERTPDIEGLAKLSNLPESVNGPHLKMLDLLVSHYTDLMRSDGDTMESLVRSLYKTRTNYLLFVNQLNQTERTLNSVLKPRLAGSVEGVDEIISAMEIHSEKFRRQSCRDSFSLIKPFIMIWGVLFLIYQWGWLPMRLPITSKVSVTTTKAWGSILRMISLNLESSVKVTTE